MPAAKARQRRAATPRQVDAAVLAFPLDRASHPSPERLDIRAYLVDGLLTPLPLDRTVIPANVSPHIAERSRREWEAAEAFRQEASAENTRRSYGTQVAAFADWCDDLGETPLPADPLVVARHLAWYATLVDEGGEVIRGEDGRLVGAVAAATVGIRLSAINAVHRLAGCPPPGDDATVREVLSGIRKTLGTRREFRKRAIDHTSLRAMIAEAEGCGFRLLRDQVAVLLRASRLTAGQMARLEWPSVDIEDEAVTLTVSADRRGGKPTVVRLPARPKSTASCPVTLLGRLRSAAPGPSLRRVFTQQGDFEKGLTRQALMATCNRLAADVGGYAGLPTASRKDLTATLVAVGHPPGSNSTMCTTRGTRDAALLATGFYLALRRSNIESLNWGDLQFERNAVTVLLRRSKTDQEGAGRTLWLPDLPADADRSVVSPTAALRRWRTAVSQLLGREPGANEPVFAILGKDGRLQLNAASRLRRLSAASVNRIVQEYARAAGLSDANASGRSPYGAHSLRAGFVTESLRDGKLTIGEVMDITGHASPDILMQYRREAERTTARAISKMLGGISAAGS